MVLLASLLSPSIAGEDATSLIDAKSKNSTAVEVGYRYYYFDRAVRDQTRFRLYGFNPYLRGSLFDGLLDVFITGAMGHGEGYYWSTPETADDPNDCSVIHYGLRLRILRVGGNGWLLVGVSRSDRRLITTSDNFADYLSWTDAIGDNQFSIEYRLPGLISKIIGHENGDSGDVISDDHVSLGYLVADLRYEGYWSIKSMVHERDQIDHGILFDLAFSLFKHLRISCDLSMIREKFSVGTWVGMSFE